MNISNFNSTKIISLMMMIMMMTMINGFPLVDGQIFFHHQPQHSLPIVYQTQAQVQFPQQVPVAHRAVVENALYESQLPPEYTNKFYKDPRIASALAKESWFTNKEMPVFDRDAEKIPRENIFKLFKNAGWIKRR